MDKMIYESPIANPNGYTISPLSTSGGTVTPTVPGSGKIELPDDDF